MKNLFTNIVVAVSGSEASILAAKYAIIMAKQYHCRLTAVYVVDTATLKQLVMTRIFVPQEGQDYEKSLQENGKRYLAFVSELGKAKGVEVQADLRSGAVYTGILECAEERKADCIVLGGWEHGRSAREIIGLAHKEVLYNATCPVLVVREQMVDQLYKAL